MGFHPGLSWNHDLADRGARLVCLTKTTLRIAKTKLLSQMFEQAASTPIGADSTRQGWSFRPAGCLRDREKSVRIRLIEMGR